MSIAPPAPIIVHGKDAVFAELLAAKEIRRYIYLRTGTLLPLANSPEAVPPGAFVVVGSKHQAVIKNM